jgi:hypothetical protein
VNAFLEVGALVRCPDRPEWGLGQVQSVLGARVTVTFENAGKVVIDGDAAPLVVERPDWL